MTRNAAEKQSSLEAEVATLRDSNVSLKQEIDSSNRSIGPLKSQRDQLEQ